MNGKKQSQLLWVNNSVICENLWLHSSRIFYLAIQKIMEGTIISDWSHALQRKIIPALIIYGAAKVYWFQACDMHISSIFNTITSGLRSIFLIDLLKLFIPHLILIKLLLKFLRQLNDFIDRLRYQLNKKSNCIV